jgi:polysaccharide export outer membrane protein
MRAIPIITLSLGPLGLLLAQGLSSGEQAQTDAPSSPSLAEFDAKPDAIDQLIAKEPPIPSPLELSAAPEFSVQPSVQLPPPPRLMTSFGKEKAGYSSPPVMSPTVSSSLLDRIVNRTVANQTAVIAQTQPANPLVSPSQEAAKTTPDPSPPPQTVSAPPINAITAAANSAQSPQSGLPDLGLSAADTSELLAFSAEPPVIQIAMADMGQVSPLFDLPQTGNNEDAGIETEDTADTAFSDLEEINLEAENDDLENLAVSPVVELEEQVEQAIEIENQIESVVVEAVDIDNSIAESLPSESSIADNQLTAFSTQFVSSIAPETTSSPEFTIAQATPPPGFEGIGETYVLGPGDSIQINLFNVPEYSGQQQILVDGTVNLPLVGRLPLAGLTIRQAEETISARYASELEYSIATVSLLQPRALRVALAGEIAQPGLYTLSSSEGGQFPTVVQAIQTAGGTTQAADLRQVQVRRRDQTGAVRSFNVNLQALLQTGDVTQNTSLRDGDTVFIPPTAEINLADSSQLATSNLRTNTDQPVTVAIVGEVALPGPYRLGGEGGQPTLIQTIQQAGGFTPTADLRQVEVRRQTRQGSEQVITLNLWDVLQTGDLAQDVVLQQGDRITIPTATVSSEEAFALASSTLSTGAIRVNIIGEVRSPGQVELRANSTLNQAVLAAGGFNGRASRKDITLIRFNSNGTVTEQELELDFSEGLNPENNPLLTNNDVILVGRSTGARITDTLSTILGVFRLLTPFGLPLP